MPRSAHLQGRPRRRGAGGGAEPEEGRAPVTLPGPAAQMRRELAVRTGPDQATKPECQRRLFAAGREQRQAAGRFQ